MKKLKIAQVGLGRLGYQHAKNIANHIPNAELISICCTNIDKLIKVQDELSIQNIYTDYYKMIDDGGFDAVIIVSPTNLHAEQIIYALNAGKHVFTEKPIDLDITKSMEILNILNKSQNLKLMLGFMRRFDLSYKIAKDKIDNGLIGDIIMIRSYTQDPIWNIKSAIKYGKYSGGQFYDMCIHDVDLIRWLTNGTKVKKLWAIGGCYEFNEYSSWGDGDNVSALIQLENDIICFVFAGRAAAHGANIETEIVGTRGTLRIGRIGTDSLLESLNNHGVTRQCHNDFQSRWNKAYIEELKHFVEIVINDKEPDITIKDGIESLKIVEKLKKSFESEKMIKM